jgi:hypothetical protein
MSILFLRLNVSRLNVRQIFHPFLSQKEKNTKEGQNSIWGHLTIDGTMDSQKLSGCDWDNDSKSRRDCLEK